MNKKLALAFFFLGIILFGMYVVTPYIISKQVIHYYHTFTEPEFLEKSRKNSEELGFIFEEDLKNSDDEEFILENQFFSSKIVIKLKNNKNIIINISHNIFSLDSNFMNLNIDTQLDTNLIELKLNLLSRTFYLKLYEDKKGKKESIAKFNCKASLDWSITNFEYSGILRLSEELCIFMKKVYPGFFPLLEELSTKNCKSSLTINEYSGELNFMLNAKEFNLKLKNKDMIIVDEIFLQGLISEQEYLAFNPSRLLFEAFDKEKDGKPVYSRVLITLVNNEEILKKAKSALRFKDQKLPKNTIDFDIDLLESNEIYHEINCDKQHFWIYTCINFLAKKLQNIE